MNKTVSGVFSADSKKRFTVSPYVLLVLIYAVSVITHILLIFRTAVLPSIMADEMLFFNIADSIASGAGLSLRGQSIAYAYIGYPLFLQPVFLLPRSVNVFHSIIVLNSLSLHASIFPVYAIGRKITGRKYLSLLFGIICAIMPEMLLAKHIMTESLAIPLALFILLYILNTLEKPTSKRLWLLGVFCGSLFTVKPGYIAVGIAFVLVNLITGFRRKQKIYFTCAWKPLVSMAATVIGYLLILRFFFGYNPEAQSLYAQQTAGFSAEHLFKTLQGAVAYSGYALIGLCVIPAAFLFLYVKKAEGPAELFAGVIALTGVVIMLGACYVIFFDEFLKNVNVPLRIHLRYLSFLFPVCLPYIFRERVSGKEIRPYLWTVCGIVLLCLAFYYQMPKVDSIRYIVDAPLLSAYMYTPDAGWLHQNSLPIVCLVFFALSVMVGRAGNSGRMRLLAAVMATVFFAVNTIALYKNDRYGMNYGLNADAAEIAGKLDGTAVYVCDTEDLTEYPVMALDIYTRSNILPVSVSQLIGQTEADGTVGRVTPDGYNGYIYSLADVTVEPDYLIFKPELLYQMLLADGAGETWLTANENYYALKLNKEQPYLHSALSGLNQKWVSENSSFVLYDNAVRSCRTVTLYLKVRAGVSGARLTLSTADGQEQTFTPTSSMDMEWISAQFSAADTGSPFTVRLEHDNGNIYVETYLVSGE